MFIAKLYESHCTIIKPHFNPDVEYTFAQLPDDIYTYSVFRFIRSARIKRKKIYVYKHCVLYTTRSYTRARAQLIKNGLPLFAPSFFILNKEEERESYIYTGLLALPSHLLFLFSFLLRENSPRVYTSDLPRAPD